MIIELALATIMVLLTAAVPEPGTSMMLLLGFAAIGMAQRRRRPAPLGPA